MKRLLSTFILLLGVGLFVNAQSVNVQFTENTASSNCEANLYCVDVQLNISDADAQVMGNASVRFSYDPEVLSFSGRTGEITKGSYTSKNFDPATSCSSLSPYAPHSFDGLIPGDFLISTLLTSPYVSGADCTSKLSDEWTTLSTICFEVLDNNQSPKLKVTGTQNGHVTNLAGSNFNDASNEPSNKFLNGSFEGLSTSFSDVCEVSSNTTNLVGNGWQIVSLQPVPVQDNMTLELQLTNAADVDIQIFDLSGKLVQQFTRKATAGLNQMSLDASQYAPGAYFLSVKKGDELLATKFIKK